MSKSTKKKFTSIYKKYYQPLVKFTFFRVSRFDLAEELTQDAFLKTWMYINKPGKKIDDLKNFLYKVTKNLIIDFYKKKEKKELSIEDVAEKDLQKIINLEELIDNKVQYNFLITSIKKLESKHKKILTDRFVKQLSINNICDKTGMSPNHVSVAIYRGVLALKEKIKI